MAVPALRPVRLPAHGHVTHPGTKPMVKRAAHAPKVMRGPQRTQRDMSYDLDSIFSTRNQGELISTPIVRTKVMRTPGLRQLRGPEAQHLDPSMSRSLAVPMSSKLTDLSGLGDIELPVVGAVSVKNLAIGAAVGAALWYFLLRR